MIDSHIHFTEDLKQELLINEIKKRELKGAALLCIPKGSKGSMLKAEQDAFSFQEQCTIPIWIFGGIRREVYDKFQVMSAENINYESTFPITEAAALLTREIIRIMEKGCTGIKMLEGKPNIRKQYHIPDFDLEIWESYWKEVEEQQIPVIFHVNDPETFWDEDQVSEFAKQSGWFYDKTYINNEEQYKQILNVLEKHPNLKILFPHFFFLSNQLERLGKILNQYENVRIDITPGIELYYNLSRQSDKAKEFFERYQDRICFGTDTGARNVICEEESPLSAEESDGRMRLITRFLETKGDYIQEVDGVYVREGNDTKMYGLGLSEEILHKIYEENFLKFIS